MLSTPLDGKLHPMEQKLRHLFHVYFTQHVHLTDSGSMENFSRLLSQSVEEHRPEVRESDRDAD